MSATDEETGTAPPPPTDNNEQYSSRAFTNYTDRRAAAPVFPSFQQSSSSVVVQQQTTSVFLRPSKLSSSSSPPMPSIVVTSSSPPPAAVTTNNNCCGSSSSILRPPRLNAPQQPTARPPAAAEETEPKPEDDHKITFVPLEVEPNAESSTNEESVVTSSNDLPQPQASFLFGQQMENRIVQNDSPPRQATIPIPTPPVEEPQQAKKRKFDEDEENVVLTGEETESNVIQLNVKLFLFSGKDWVERGRGLLRLNDSSEDDSKLQSRLIIRTKGSLRVILNTKVWSEMVIEKTNDKSIKFTAVDSTESNDESGNIKIFLVMASVSEIESLYNALDCRIKSLKNYCKKSRTSD